MRSDKAAYLHLLVVALGLVLAPSLYAQGYRIAPVPDWVKSVQPLPDDQADQQNNSNGMRYLLVDEQWQVSEDRQSHYARIASKALNSSGVEVGAPVQGELICLAFYTVIWSLYFMKSKRVKATFTRRRKNTAPTQDETAARRDAIPQETG